MKFEDKAVSALKLVLEAAIESQNDLPRSGFTWGIRIDRRPSANDGFFQLIHGFAHRRPRAKRSVKQGAMRSASQHRAKIFKAGADSRNTACLLGSGAVHPTTSRLFPCAISFTPSQVHDLLVKFDENGGVFTE